jgi:hypothetical protein
MNVERNQEREEVKKEGREKGRKKDGWGIGHRSDNTWTFNEAYLV